MKTVLYEPQFYATLIFFHNLNKKKVELKFNFWVQNGKNKFIFGFHWVIAVHIK